MSPTHDALSGTGDAACVRALICLLLAQGQQMQNCSAVWTHTPGLLPLGHAHRADRKEPHTFCLLSFRVASRGCTSSAVWTHWGLLHLGDAHRADSLGGAASAATAAKESPAGVCVTACADAHLSGAKPVLLVCLNVFVGRIVLETRITR